MRIRATIACLLIAGFSLPASVEAQQETPAPWQRITSGAARKLVVDGAGNFYLVRNVGVDKSTDQGLSWTQTTYAPATAGGTNTSGAALSWNNLLFVGSAGQGVWVSSDAGSSWANSFATGVNTLAYDIAANSTAAVMTYGGSLRGLYKYNSGTNSWTQKFTSVTEFWDFATDSFGNFYATQAEGGTQNGGIHKSTDNGETWTKIYSTTGANNPAHIACRNDSLVYVARNGKVFQSTNLGAAWTQVGVFPAGATTDLQFVGSTHLFGSSSTAGVYYSTDFGATWTQWNAGLPTLNVSRLTEYQGLVYAGTDSGLYLISDISVTPQTLASYPLDGDAVDQSGNGLNGTLVGAVPTADRSGAAGTALLFDGTGSYVDLPESTSLVEPKSQISIEAWINASALNGGYIISSGNQNDFAISLLADGHLKVELFGVDGASGGVFLSSSALTAGQWYHIALVYSGTSESIYINGVLDTSRTASGVVGNSPQPENIMIGAYNGGSFFAGAIDGLRITNYPAPATEFPLQLPPANVQAAASDTTINFSWANGGGSAPLQQYYIYRGTSPDSLVLFDSTTAISYSDTNAIPGVTYYYAISAVDQSGFEGQQSAQISGSIPLPAVPALSAPADGAVMVGVNPVLEWSAAPHSTSYDIQVATDSLFTSIVFEDSGVRGTSLSVSGLQNSSVYYWHVRGRNKDAVSDYSPLSGFTTTLAAPTLLAPANASADHPIPVEIRWGAVAGATVYFVEVSTDSLFGVAPVVSDSLWPDTLRSITGLSSGTAYYWRVQAGNGIGYGDMSPVWSFATLVDPPDVPVLSAPLADATSVPLDAILEWNPAGRAASYQLQVATDSLFTTIVVNDSALTDTSRQVGPLASLTGYYWHVRAVNAGGVSDYSAFRQFTTTIAPPEVPQLVSPTNAASDQDVQPTLVWNSSVRAEWYHLQLSRDSLFTEFVVNESGLTDTSRLVGPLENAAVFYWRVRAGNEGGISEYSATSQFTTIVAIPGQPVLLAPQALAVNQPVVVDFRWATTEGATAYIFQVGTDSTFAGDLFHADSSLADTSKTVSGFDHSTRYFWRVGAMNAGGIGLFSSTWSFTTGLDQVALVSPADGAVDQPVAVELSWHPTAGATAYHVQVSPDSLFGSGLVLDDQNVSDTARAVAGLANDTEYFWRVAAKNGDGSGSYSVVRSFTTIVAGPAKLQLSSPADGAVLTSNFITLSWHPGSPAIDKYAVEVSADSLFSNPVMDSTIVDTSKSVTVPSASGTYWWRARAHNAAGWGPYSDAWKAVLMITSADEMNVIPGEYSLGQNYPNPFNPSTAIRYGLPVRSFVTLTVYNMLGQQVATLIEGDREAGYHEVKFDARNLASGVYLYRLQAKRQDGSRGGDFIQTRRLLLVR